MTWKTHVSLMVFANIETSLPNFSSHSNSRQVQTIRVYHGYVSGHGLGTYPGTVRVRIRVQLGYSPGTYPGQGQVRQVDHYDPAAFRMNSDRIKRLHRRSLWKSILFRETPHSTLASHNKSRNSWSYSRPTTQFGRWQDMIDTHVLDGFRPSWNFASQL